MVSEIVLEIVKSIKKTLGNRCFFCENALEDGKGKDFFSLTLCNICHDKYELDREFNEKRELNGYALKWRENAKTIKTIFANRCFFCERDVTKDNKEKESENYESLFLLCESSCLQKYKMIKNWQSLGLI